MYFLLLGKEKIILQLAKFKGFPAQILFITSCVAIEVTQVAVESNLVY